MVHLYFLCEVHLMIPLYFLKVAQSCGSGGPEGEPEADWDSQKGEKALRKVGVPEVRRENRRLLKRVENFAQTGGTAIAGRQPKPFRKILKIFEMFRKDFPDSGEKHYQLKMKNASHA